MTIVVKDGDMQIERLTLGPYDTNAYIITCTSTQDSLLVDAPAEAGTIMAKLNGTKPRYILMTHNHMDHVGALAELHSRLGVPVATHIGDFMNLPSPVEKLLKDGDVITIGTLKFEVIYTPGHTEGSLCFRSGKYLLAGDTIFPGGPGKTRTPADFEQIIRSITGKIMVLPEETQIFPGHGEPTTVKKSKEEYAVFASRQHDPNLCGDVLWLSS